MEQASNQLDYLNFFGFKEHPFKLLPDPSFFFPAEPHLRAKDVLVFGIKRGEGFLVLTGEAGTGKSLLLRMFIDELPPDKVTAVVVAPTVSPRGLLKLILEEMKISVENDCETAFLFKEFEKAIIELAADGKELVIIIDEAQNLPIKTLEQLRLLSNIETGKKKLLQILLLGQPELNDILKSKGLGQLVQRITVNERLRSLNKNEIQGYINFRLNKAGRGDIAITSSAIKCVFNYTRGIPRLINKLMDRTLLVAASEGSKRITKDVVENARDTLPELLFEKSRRSYVPIVLSLIMAFTLFFLGLNIATHKNVFHTQKGIFSIFNTKISNEEKKSQVAIIRVKRAMVREGPGQMFPQLTTVSLGDRFDVVNEKENWVKITVFDAKGNRKNGWIRKDLIILRN